MMRFKLLAGFHAHGDKVYSPGDVIETDIDLAARLGKNKFERLHDETVKTNPPPPSVSKESEGETSQERPQRRKQ